MILANSCNEIDGFEEGNQSVMGALGTLEALCGSVGALGSTYMDLTVSFWQRVATKSMVLGNGMAASGSIGQHSHAAPSSFWHTVVTKS